MIRLPGNPVIGRGSSINEVEVAIQVFRIAYIVLTTIIIIKETRSTSQTIKDKNLNE